VRWGKVSGFSVVTNLSEADSKFCAKLQSASAAKRKRPNQALRQVIHFAGVRRFGEGQGRKPKGGALISFQKPANHPPEGDSTRHQPAPVFGTVCENRADLNQSYLFSSW
jgi:hypothetical protein